MRHPSLLLALTVILGGLAFSAAVPAITRDQITSRLADLETFAGDPGVKQQLAQWYQQARGFLDAQDKDETASASFRKAIEQGPEIRRELRMRLAELERASRAPPVVQRERTLDAAGIEHVLDAARTERATIESDLGSYELELRNLSLRASEIPDERAVVTARLDELERTGAGLEGHRSDELGRARGAALDAEAGARQAELERLNQEQLSRGSREEVLSLRRDVALLELQRLSTRIAALETLLLDKRQEATVSAQADAEKIRASIADMHPVAQRIATENAALSTELAGVLADQAATVQRRTGYATQRERLEGEFDLARQRLQIAGASSTLGRILVDQRRRLPRVAKLRTASKASVAEVSRVSLRRIEIDEAMRRVRENVSNVPAFLGAAGVGGALDNELRPQVGKLLESQLDLLTNLNAGYGSYLRALDAADGELQQLVNSVDAYNALLDERLLWIPNAAPLSVELFAELRTALEPFLRNDVWAAVADDFANGLRAAWLRTAVLSALIALLLWLRPRLRARLTALAAEQQTPGGGHVRDTLRAFGIAALRVAPVPLLGWTAGEILKAGIEPSEFGLALGATLQVLGALGLVAGWWQEALGGAGILTGHFHLEPARATEIAVVWRRFSSVFVPCYAFATTFDLGTLAARYGLRRALFLVAMAAVLALGLWASRRYPGAVALRLGGYALPLRPAVLFGTALPALVLSALSALGYQYTAVELSKSYLHTVLLLAVASLLYWTALRWLELAGRRLREQAAPLAQTQIDGGSVEAVPDLALYDTQARLIIRNVVGWSTAAGLFWVWRDVLPALTVFDHAVLWQISVKDAAGNVQFQAITLANVALALVIALVTVLASRNIPGALEIALLQRLQVHHGSRYAITTLLQYAIVALGLSLLLSTLGLRWSQVQWLVAALGVGLGFGLQEIFANFISGLILLFERPIRVGDVVTIGDNTGRVNRIQIRATTIRDVDNKEIVVPNKTFITERFLNWTLTDQVTRIVIPVGIAYGADIELAIRLLLDVAAAHPKVMRDPAPQALFTGFGDSALQCELMVYAEELGHRADVRHELNREIYRRFAEHGIEIPFPQRDVHVRSLPAEIDLTGQAFKSRMQSNARSASGYRDGSEPSS